MAIVSQGKKHHSVVTQGELIKKTEDLLDSMNPEELALLEHLIADPSIGESFSSLDYEREPLSPEEWLESGYHSGVYGRSMYDPLKEDLCNIVHGNFFEIIMTGALGTGKTYLGRAVTVYNLYKMSCLRSPQKFWDLSETTRIAFVSIGIKKAQIEKTVFGEFGPELETIDYFKIDNPIVRATQEQGFEFHKNLIIRPGGASEGDVIGEAVYGALVDEINFRTSEAKAKDKMKSLTGMSPTDKLVDAIRARIESRFQRGKILGGFIHIASSKRSEFDFTEKRAISRSNDPTVFIRDRAIWEVKSPKNYSGKKFKVFVGTAGIPSEKINEERYLELKDNMPEGCMVIEVPIEHEAQFSEGRDIEQAVRDVAGVSTVGFDKYFKDRYALDEMFGARLPNYLTHVGGRPIESGEVVFGTPLEIPEENFVLDRETGRPRRVKRHPKSRRVAHIDVGLTGDRLGLAIGHIVDWVDVPVYSKEDGRDITERMPRIEFDLAIGFTPPKNGEIILERIRGLIYQLKSMGMPIHKVTMDSFQCLTYETPIFIVGHGIMPIGEVALKFKGKKFYVLSRDTKTGELVVALAKNARRTGEDVSNLVRVKYNSNQDEFTCTPEHKILLDDGRYVMAKHLKEGDVIDSAFKVYNWINHDEDGVRCRLYDSEEEYPKFPIMKKLVEFALSTRRNRKRFKDKDLGYFSYDDFGAHIKHGITKRRLWDILNNWDSLCKRLHEISTDINTPRASEDFKKLDLENVDLGEDRFSRFMSLIAICGDFGLSELSLYSPDNESFEKTKLAMFGNGFKEVSPMKKHGGIDYTVSEVYYTNKVKNDVFDIEVPRYKNFALGTGAIVHNSRDSLQIFTEKGYEAELLSVDKTSGPYDTLKRSILERRTKTNANPCLKDEILGLEKDEKTGKIDHGVNTSKDISDALAGVVDVLSKEKPTGQPTVYSGYDRGRDEVKSNWLIDSEIKRKPTKPMERKGFKKVLF